MVITDIKGTKIRVENEAHSCAIQRLAGDLGYKWRGENCFDVACVSAKHLYFSNYHEISFGDNVNNFEDKKQKEIWFYNGEFHDKPQDDEYHDFEWKNGDKCICKNNREIDYTYIGSHPSKNGHFVFNEWKGIEYVHNDHIERVFSIGELKLQIEKKDMKIEEFVSVLSYLVSVSQESEEKLCELLNDSGNYGESDALCKARLLLAKHNKG